MAAKKAKKTAGRTPAKVEQSHGGALYAGGVPGNKGGRPPDAFKAKMAELLERKQTIEYLQRCLEGREGPSPYMAALNFTAERAKGKVPNVTTLRGDEDAPLRVVVERE